MLETHPFGTFTPLKAKYLILGSFVAKRRAEESSYDWFYGTKRNQFWPILEGVYHTKLKNKKAKKKLFTDLSIAIADIIYQCERRDNNNSDFNLINISYNTSGIDKLLKKNKIEIIYFSSRFVEKEFKKHFKQIISHYPQIKLITLPSPSPRYAIINIEEKSKKYSQILPKLKRVITSRERY